MFWCFSLECCSLSTRWSKVTTCYKNTYETIKLGVLRLTRTLRKPSLNSMTFFYLFEWERWFLHFVLERNLDWWSSPYSLLPHLTLPCAILFPFITSLIDLMESSPHVFLEEFKWSKESSLRTCYSWGIWMTEIDNMVSLPNILEPLIISQQLDSINGPWSV